MTGRTGTAQADHEAAIRIATDAFVAALVAAFRAEAIFEQNAPERLHDIRATAAILNVGRTFLYSEIAAGRLASLKAGKRRLVSESAIAAYIAAARGSRP